MANDNNRNPNEKLPGEKPEGTHHFNPGNQSGKGPVFKKDGPKQGNKSAEESREKQSRE